MSTLPRTKSLSGADTSSLSRSFRDRNRPSSLCEASWNKIYPSSGQADRLTRTPSQANNLCTTVPTSIVNRTLSGRHTPTRSSLRHSRMAVLARNGRDRTSRRKSPNDVTRGSFGRVAILIILAYILVGVVGGLLAMWLMKWVPSLPFKEVPHYAAGTIVLNGFFILTLFYCFPQMKKSFSRILKILLLVFLSVSLLNSACVCVFDVLHLVNLAPMECQMKNDIIIHSHPASSKLESSRTQREDESTIRLARMERLYSEAEEGSGESLLFDDEEGFQMAEHGLEMTPESSFEEVLSNDSIYMNVSVCICSRMKMGWRIVMNYPNLTCHEVKNILPLFFVASCFVTVVGAILSAILMYLVWTFRLQFQEPRGENSLCEAQPFIFKGNFKLSQNHSPSKDSPVNGVHRYR